MKDFINPYSDKMVAKIEGWLTDLPFIKPDIMYNYNEWLEILENTEKAEHMTCQDVIAKTCDHIVDMTYIDEYDRFYTIKQFRQMYNEAVKNVVRDTIKENF